MAAGMVEDLVVSLTSFPVRIGKLHRVIRGLLAQSLQPRKIVLYLSLEEFPDRACQRAHGAENDRFEIRFVEGNLRPYKKLLYALADFPRGNDPHRRRRQSLSSDCLARLWAAASVANLRTIICVRGRRIRSEIGEIIALHGMAGNTIVQAELHDISRWRLGHPLSPAIAHPMIDRLDLVSEIAPPERRCLVQGDEPIAGRAMSCDRQHEPSSAAQI